MPPPWPPRPRWRCRGFWPLKWPVSNSNKSKNRKAEGPNIAPDGRGGGNAQFGSRRRKRPQPYDAEDDEPRASPSPLVGNLLNVKV